MNNDYNFLKYEACFMDLYADFWIVGGLWKGVK
jgi:hypothetical protein